MNQRKSISHVTSPTRLFDANESLHARHVHVVFIVAALLGDVPSDAHHLFTVFGNRARRRLKSQRRLCLHLVRRRRRVERRHARHFPRSSAINIARLKLFHERRTERVRQSAIDTRGRSRMHDKLALSSTLRRFPRLRVLRPRPRHRVVHDSVRRQVRDDVLIMRRVPVPRSNERFVCRRQRRCR